jgi:hypothetical protein
MEILFVILHCINSALAVSFVVLSIALFMPKYIRKRNNHSSSYFSKCLMIILCVTVAFAAFAIALNFLDGLSNFDVAGYVFGFAIIAWLVLGYPINIGISVVAHKCDVIDIYGSRISFWGNRGTLGVAFSISGFLSIVLSLASYCIILAFNLA